MQRSLAKRMIMISRPRLELFSTNSKENDNKPLQFLYKTVLPNVKSSIIQLTSNIFSKSVSSLDSEEQSILFEKMGLVKSIKAHEMLETAKKNVMVESSLLLKETEDHYNNRLKVEVSKIKEEQLTNELLKLKMEGELIQQQSNLKREQQQQQQQQPQKDHPLLGKLILDLSYKRIYLTTVKQLVSLPIWDKQRSFKLSRSRIMAGEKLAFKEMNYMTTVVDQRDGKKREKEVIGLAGVITIFEDDKGELSIIDGQHRVGMLNIMMSKIENDGGEQILSDVVVEVFVEPLSGRRDDDQSSSSNYESKFAANLFTEINKSEPVKLIDLPFIGTMSDKKTLNKTVTQLEALYPNMFSKSVKCRPPHCNSDNMRESIFASEILKTHKLDTDKKLLNWLMKRNVEIGERVTKAVALDGGVGLSCSKSGLEKAIKNQFFLGVENSWLYV